MPLKAKRHRKSKLKIKIWEYAAILIMINILLLSPLLMSMNIYLYSPSDSTESPERKPTFIWYGEAESFELQIDDNPEFSSPMRFKTEEKQYTLLFDLDFGKYYWRVAANDGRISDSREYILTSLVSLERNETDLKNSGNTDLVVDILGKVTGYILAINETIIVEERDSVFAWQRGFT